jgi:hypothetical protein
MVASSGSKEEIWLQWLCSWIRFEKRDMNINCNNQNTIFLEKNTTYHSNTKHIYVQYHFVTGMVESNKVLLEKVDTLERITESLTKSVSVVKLSWCREEMGIVSLGM